MNYFKRHIGDYHKKAGRLTMLEHGAYTLLIDACYDRERFPTKEEAIDWCWARTDEEIAAVDFILTKFFDLQDGHYVQARIQEEVDKYHANAQTNSRIAKEREAKRKARIEHEACTDGHEPPPNHKPLTTNNINTSSGDDLFNSVVDLYHEILPDLPSVKIVSPKRKAQFKARVKSYPKANDIEWWRVFFTKAGESNFMMGRTGNWQASLDYFLQPNGFAAVIEGKHK